ncbi:endonuclease/exonuclease/phosphatase family protein [Romeria aff. gracilis LEGE 07310]|uniref:Endonuclease/exonuclease/phosphatase family protein n=1 Tax=Vasconcelosia minhoensis LEGE 07310 TaxID=915328 RepID=A0A8J7AX74_9CYAN|nr:endonuclease/exonuclease/phosphatase family protein [Romeria aff. gracilis LEGE 07310]
MSRFKLIPNLFRPTAEAGPDDPAKYEERLDSLAQVIRDLDPDVLAVQEVGGPEPFEDLVAALQDQYPHQRLSTNPDRRGIRVGFLSKLEIAASDELVQFPEAGLPTVPRLDSKGDFYQSTRLNRGALRIQVQSQSDIPIYLITAHLKSKLLTFPNPSGRARFSPRNENERARVAGTALLQRTAEAVALRIWANDLLNRQPEAALILLGDLNDVTDAATTQILQGPPGSEIGTRGFNAPDKGNKARLFNLAPLIPEERRFSRIYKGNGELIDHILASEELLSGQPRQVPAVDSHVDLLGGLPSISGNPNERREEPGSDHAPVTATFDI